MIQCDGCKQWYHPKCVNLTNQFIKAIELHKNQWYCDNCDIETSSNSDNDAETFTRVVDISETIPHNPDNPNNSSNNLSSNIETNHNQLTVDHNIQEDIEMKDRVRYVRHSKRLAKKHL